MLHNTAEPKLTPRSQKAHRGAKNHIAEPNIIPWSHFISTAEPTPQRGEFVYLWASVPKTLKWVAVYSSVTFHING